MTETINLEHIRNHWTTQAQKYGQSHCASWSDQCIMEMEINEISKYLENDDHVLDVGCANGYSTVRYGVSNTINIKGIDYISEMIAQARKNIKSLKLKVNGKVDFAVDNVISLKEMNESYDKVIATRVIINLGEWNLQIKGLRECSRILRKGGLLLLSEATKQGWQKLNQFRREWNLPDISIPSFNKYIDQDQLIESVSDILDIIEIKNFTSTYYIGTRVLKPLLINALGQNIDVADPDMEWNRWFSQLPSWGDYGTQKLFVFRKR